MLKKLVFAAAALALAAPALADHGHSKHWKKPHRHYYYAPRPVVVMPPPRVYYTPPAPVHVAPPAPVYYQPGVSIRFHFPL
jgi:hypothetical protein